MMEGTKKGQVISTDIAIALTAFMIVLVVFLWGWKQASISKDEFEEDHEMIIVSENVGDLLINSKGYPENWNDFNSGNFTVYNVESVGLSDYSGKVSFDKLATLADLNNTNYGIYKDILGLSGYNFYLEFWVFDGNFSGDADYEIGLVNDDASKVGVLERFFVFTNLTEGKMKMRIFKE